MVISLVQAVYPWASPFTGPKKGNSFGDLVNLTGIEYTKKDTSPHKDVSF